MLGFRNDIEQLLKAADVFCLLSHREGLPVALIEALATGLPCVTLDVRGCRDVLNDAPNSRVCKTTTAEAIVTAIESLSTETVQDRNPNRDAAKKYSLQNTIASFSEIYSETLGHNEEKHMFDTNGEQTKMIDGVLN